MQETILTMLTGWDIQKRNIIYPRPMEEFDTIQHATVEEM